MPCALCPVPCALCPAFDRRGSSRLARPAAEGDFGAQAIRRGRAQVDVSDRDRALCPLAIAIPGLAGQSCLGSLPLHTHTRIFIHTPKRRMKLRGAGGRARSNMAGPQVAEVSAEGAQAPKRSMRRSVAANVRETIPVQHEPTRCPSMTSSSSAARIAAPSSHGSHVNLSGMLSAEPARSCTNSLAVAVATLFPNLMARKY